jgi:hypothetical protein
VHRAIDRRGALVEGDPGAVMKGDAADYPRRGLFV